MGKRKQPVQVKKTGDKKPVEAPNTVIQEKLRFRFNLTDIEGPWCLSRVSKADHVAILKKLKEFEGMTVGEIAKGNPGKDYEFVSNNDANKRLLELLATTEVSRLRINAKCRLYGVRENQYFSIPWWDPEHASYPLSKD